MYNIFLRRFSNKVLFKKEETRKEHTDIFASVLNN